MTATRSCAGWSRTSTRKTRRGTSSPSARRARTRSTASPPGATRWLRWPGGHQSPSSSRSWRSAGHEQPANAGPDASDAGRGARRGRGVPPPLRGARAARGDHGHRAVGRPHPCRRVRGRDALSRDHEPREAERQDPAARMPRTLGSWLRRDRRHAHRGHHLSLARRNPRGDPAARRARRRVPRPLRPLRGRARRHQRRAPPGRDRAPDGAGQEEQLADPEVRGVRAQGARRHRATARHGGRPGDPDRDVASAS